MTRIITPAQKVTRAAYQKAYNATHLFVRRAQLRLEGRCRECGKPSSRSGTMLFCAGHLALAQLKQRFDNLEAWHQRLRDLHEATHPTLIDRRWTGGPPMALKIALDKHRDRMEAACSAD